MAQNGPCVEVAKGSVGEDEGPASQVEHHVEAKIEKLMVLRTTETDLCGNTGVVATLLVDGVVQASGVITGDGQSIQAGATPGATVVGIVHTFPLFNDIVCVRLGNLYFRLDECDLV